MGRSLCLLFLVLLFPFGIVHAHTNVSDSVMERVRLTAVRAQSHVRGYRAEIYVKDQLDIIRRNSSFKFIPGLFKSPKELNRHLIETYSDLYFTAPNTYRHQIRAYTSTLGRIYGISDALGYLNPNIYRSYLIEDKLLSPLAPNGNKYYLFFLDSVTVDSSGRKQYCLRFCPRNKSHRLVEGDMVVTDGAWSVRKIHFKGKNELLSFDCDIMMGEVDSDEEYLPVSNQAKTFFVFAYNNLESYYLVSMRYADIETSEGVDSLYDAREKRTCYDKTGEYSFEPNESVYLQDFHQFDTFRCTALTSSEAAIYERSYARLDSLSRLNGDGVDRHNSWEIVGDFLLSGSDWLLGPKTSVKRSAFINPFLFQFSKTSGTSYRQDLRVMTELANGQSVGVNGRIGYNFKYKEFYWNTGAQYVYKPERNGVLTFNVGNGNRIISSQILDELKRIPTDSAINLNQLNLDVFTDFNFELSNNIEVKNGVDILTGFVFHHRTPAKHPEESFRQIQLPEDLSIGLQKNIRPSYNSFALKLGIRWTPCLYYYYDGRRKMNIGSKFPTFRLDYERGLKNILNSTSIYERTELDINGKFKLGLLSNLYYRFGSGMFSNMKETYFVDFTYFRRSNIPDEWDDEMSGTFQALPSRWYNASRYYVRTHITFETPFLILPHVLKYTSHIRHERVYLNLLTMQRLGPYFEVGYGIGTFVFDTGLFLSLKDYDTIGFGYKLTIQLFR